MKATALGLVICRNYFKELQAAVKDIGISNVQTYCIRPTCLHHDRDEILKIEEQLFNLKQKASFTYVLTPASCSGTNFDSGRNCLQNHTIGSCLELFAPASFIRQLTQEGNYIVTPGWIMNWKSVVREHWKFTGDSAKLFFKDTVRQICVIDTQVHTNYLPSLEEFSRFVGLEYRIIHMGLDHFRLQVERLISKWQYQNELDNLKIKLRDNLKKLADYTMALEILKDLANLSSEKALIQNIFKLFMVLFSPGKMVYTPINEHIHGEIQSFDFSDYQENNLPVTKNHKHFYEITRLNNGFNIQVNYENEIIGQIQVEDILFTQHIDTYSALTDSISSVLGLFIYNSREYGKILKEKIEILKTNEIHLKEKNDELLSLYMELQATEEEIRSSNEELIATAEELTDTNTKLEIALKKAEENEALKSAFLHNMSHEIRTPLNAILGFSSMLTGYYNNRQKLEYFAEIIDKRGRDLLDIIDGILDIAKIESGQMSLIMEPCNIGDLLQDLETFFKEYQKQIKKTHINFSILNPFKDSGIYLITDAPKLKQIFINLINNAFKFTSDGKIEVGFRNIEIDVITFYVSDTGIGIPAEKHADIFDRFIQVNNDNTRLYSGTGLGLSILKGLLNIMGGKIWLDSQPGKGSTFYFSIPYKPVEHYNFQKKAPPGQLKKVKSGTVILVVEDDVYNAEYLLEILSVLNCEILHASSGKEAIETANLLDPDLILMDIRLPDMTGFEASKIIKHEKPDQIIIAQTAFATSADQLKAIESGCDDFISKPVKKEVLLSKITDIIGTPEISKKTMSDKE